MRRVLAYAVILATAAAPMARAQSDDDAPGGMLVGLLENTLSGDNRAIKVVGLDGALSSRATLEELTVSDDEGVWLTITNAVLDWNRLALLRGRFSVNALTADEIIIARKPNPSPATADLPDPEAQPFELPELPVSIAIDEIDVTRISLGEPLVGLAAELGLTGSVVLADGALDAQIDLARLDRTSDNINLTAKYANETRQITLDLLVVEDAGGLISKLLKVPDRPSIRLAAKGQGPLTDFTTDIALASNGTDRLSGQVTLREVPQADDAAQTGAAIAFKADIDGDVTPLLAEDFQAFFGPQTTLDVAGQRNADGRLEIETLDVTSNALILSGALDLAADGVIEKVLLSGRIAPPDGTSVVLPAGGARPTIQSAQIAVRLDAETDNTWDATLSLDGLTVPQARLRQLSLRAGGTLDQGDAMRLRGTLGTRLAGLDFADPDLNQAVGPDVTLNGQFAMQGGGVFEIPQMILAGDDYSASFEGEIDGLESGFAIDGITRVGATDLARFAGLAGRPIGGRFSARMDGKGTPLGGAFDVTLDARGEDLVSGIAQLDPLITGATTLSVALERDETGVQLDELTLNGTALSAYAKGSLRSNAIDVTLRARLDDVARVLPDLKGPATVSGRLAQDTDGVFNGQMRADGPMQSFARIDGSLDPTGEADLTYDLSVAQLERLLKQLPGTLTSKGSAQRRGKDWTINSTTGGTTGITADLKAVVNEETLAGKVDFDARLEEVSRFVPQVQGPATFTGDVEQDEKGALSGKLRADGPNESFADLSGALQRDGAADITFDAALARIERFLPEVSGTIKSQGTARRDGTLWTIDGTAQGPAEIDAKVAGTIDEATLEADLTSSGQVRLGIANSILTPNSIRGVARFDLAMKGPPTVETLSGTISTAGSTVVLPDVAQTINDLGATITLDNGTGQVDVGGAVRAGGRFTVRGPIALSPPFDANITTTLQQIILTDNISYDSSANGQLVFAGPLTGNGKLTGQIEFGETNINLATASGSVGAAPIPDTLNVGASAPVTETRRKAGLIKTEDGSGGPVFGLDIALIAADRVFARGRGLNAELGGQILIRGTTANVVPSGQINLIRGRFDILGRRLRLTEGRVTLQGSLLPYVEFAATTSTADGDATMKIEGPLDQPELEITSNPERPTEEALAMLVFGDRFSDLSPLKIAQLAAQLAQLSGVGSGANDSAREGLGVDTLDLNADEDGGAEVGAGTYISEDIYTEVTINTRGETELNLNFDLTDSLTVKGNVDNTGDTGIGLFFERDY